MLLIRLIDLYSIVLVAAVIVSWTSLSPYHPLVVVTRVLTEPLLAPIRRVVRPIGGIDFSPMVLLIALRLLRSVLR